MLKLTAPRAIALVICALPAPLMVAGPALAQTCATAVTGARCVVARPSPVVVATAPGPQAMPAPIVEIGQTLERGEYSIMINADYYGLPPVRDGWVYMRIGRDVFRVNWQTHEVLESVTAQTARNFF